MPASSGWISSVKTAACRCDSRPAWVSVLLSSSLGVRPEGMLTGNPAAILRIRPATRTMKNSSRLEAKIARNRTRSSSGVRSSSASSSTRWLNRTQLCSLSR